MTLVRLRLTCCGGGLRRALHCGARRFGAEKSAAPAEIKGVPYSKLKIGVPKETWTNERRVGVSPAVAATLVKKGFTVGVEENAGAGANFLNKDYEAAGATVISKKDVYTSGMFAHLQWTSVRQ